MRPLRYAIVTYRAGRREALRVPSEIFNATGIVVAIERENER